MNALKKTASVILSLFFSTRLHVMIAYRTSRWLSIKLPWTQSLVIPCARHFMRIYAGCDISPKAIIGKRFSMPHPIGVVIGDGVTIGDDVKMWQQTTIGSHGQKGKKVEYPAIGNRVRIYAKATVIGGVIVEDDAVIGAHSLVMINVPAGRTAAGCPAVILQAKDGDTEC